MLQIAKNILKKFLPNSIFTFVASFRYGFFGPYKSWAEVEDKSIGYDSNVILNKVKEALLKVKNGEAVYERDSVLFYTEEYTWPLLCLLCMIAMENDNKLNLIDFGGSLGSTYFQNKKLLYSLTELRWNIVEQPNFVKCGRNFFSDSQLNFYNSIEECLITEKSSVIIFSSVIEYLEEPYDIIKTAIEHGFEYIIFDRTTFVQEGEDVVALQKVPPQVYTASYPCWFFDKDKLVKFLSPKYDLICEFDALGGKIKQHKISGKYKGLFFKIKK